MKILKNKKIIIFWLLALITLATIILTLEKINIINLYSRADTTPAETLPRKEKVNYDGPSEKEKKAGDEAKSKISENTHAPSTPDPSTGKVSVAPIISIADVYNGNLEVAAFISIVEENGSCTINLKKDSKVTTAAVNTATSAQTTNCQTYSAPLSSLEKGTYHITVTYSSDKHFGTSESREVTIQ